MNAEDNPFRRSAIANIRYEITSEDLQHILDKLKIQNYCGAILGPHGSGKSTLMEDIQHGLEGEGKKTQWIRIHKESEKSVKRAAIKKILACDVNTINFLDGAESLGVINWITLAYKIKKKRRTLIATTHYPCPLPRIFKTYTSQAQALELTQKLAAEYWNPTLEAVAKNAYTKNKGDVREVFRACYLYLSHREYTVDIHMSYFQTDGR